MLIKINKKKVTLFIKKIKFGNFRKADFWYLSRSSILFSFSEEYFKQYRFK